MNRMAPINILVCGLNWSGSGAVVDLFKEYNQAVIISGGALDFPAEGGLRLIGEFELFRSPGFIADFLSEKEQFFTENHVEDIINKQILSFRYKVLIYILKLKSIREIRSAFKIYRQVISMKKSLLDLVSELKKTKDIKIREELSKAWLYSVLEEFEASNKKLAIFDQAIHLGQHDDVWTKFYDPYKLIIVHRDPRDILTEQFNYKYLFREQMDSNAIALYGDLFEDAIQYRIDTISARMENVDKLFDKTNEDNILLIRFEDLVQNYEEIKEKIQLYTGLEERDHVEKFKHFDPNKSQDNIGIHANSKLVLPDSKLEGIMKWYNNH